MIINNIKSHSKQDSARYLLPGAVNYYSLSKSHQAELVDFPITAMQREFIITRKMKRSVDDFDPGPLHVKFKQETISNHKIHMLSPSEHINQAY